MRGKGVLKENSKLRTCSGKKTVKSGQVNGNSGNAIVIDLDSDNVFTIDGTDSLQEKFRGSSSLREGKKFSFEGVIYVDDDDENDVDPPVRAEDGGDLDSDATSSKSPCSVFNHRQNSVCLDCDDCQVVQEKTSAFQFSKHKGTFFVKSPSRNRYGLDPTSDSGSSDSDFSDCEIIEDSLGKFREQWEKAYQKKKHVVNCQSGLEDQASASGSNSESPASGEEENRRGQHGEAPVCSTSSSVDYGKENLSEYMETDPVYMKSTPHSPRMDNFFVDSNQKFEQETFTHVNHRSAKEKEDNEQNFGKGLHSCDSYPRSNNFDKRNTSFQDEGDDDESFEVPTFNISSPIENEKQASSVDKEKLDHGQPFMSNSRTSDDAQVGNIFSPNENEHQTVAMDKEKLDNGQLYEAQFGDISSANEKENRTSAMGKEKLDDGQLYEAQVDDVSCSDDRVGVPEEVFLHSSLSEGKSEVSSEKACYQGEVRQDSKEVTSCNNTCNETLLNEEPCRVEARESCDIGDSGHAQDGHATLVSSREKLKETDEYKRATEEEWASRQRELRIQSEEAKRLRKRKKADLLRLEDMQRRQKQRVEEVRETQKKDEENLNLKEQLRGEIRKELDRLEMTCIDMTSLLRGLGIQVGSSFLPKSHEVRAAYKRAVLKFHPDRASRSDIRQQVEAEEKFKLISRMREKFLSSSCC
ncbi:UBA domain-containing protein 7 isoform X1 [Ziziphus jujuba]|uniref:UBA domain-containing protein 7 isoform X1 n=1 Tax=Ziziphus jujuba TaxID=326968 RepID=A0ABM3I192_ZIZJJ|nr:UBA domain-containing protein 7 isoform X1 [Ziziphus jujuba]XP_048318539.2 UBA domain-containing protein 7 isoform X1 [Ziziphus jujuba]